MWFRNLSIHRLANFNLTAAQVGEALAKHAFHPGTSLELQTNGWASPRDNGELVHAVGRQMLLTLRTEKKLLPTNVVNQVTRARAVEIEEQQGYKPGRKQMRELKEQVTEELLPRAFAIRRDTRVWIDADNGWLVIDAASSGKADEARGMLFKALDPLNLTHLHVNQSPVAAMTEWLARAEAPAGFTIDQDIELQSSAENKATVRYARHPVDAEDMGRHIAAGKRVTKLAMTWNDRVSFVLTDSMTIKRVAALDVIKEGNQPSQNEEEAFDGDFLLMAGELVQLLAGLVDALGGERVPEGQADAEAAPAPHAATDGPDPLYDQAVTIVRAHKRASISLVQRHLQIGYNRAARLLERMEADGVVNAMDNAANREVLAPQPEPAEA